MPASLFPEMERNSGGGGSGGGGGGGLEDQRALQLALELSMLGLNNENDSLNTTYEADTRNKKSQNTTECVPVPSSEHVAEIVGRQGCKIKALRAKTNTYIKTPVRGEEPVFVVTGRKEDVNAAKREILSAAEHFSQIRAQRKNNLNGSLAPGPNSNIPGQTTIQVRVPYRVVGLVVGPKGATIKRIQQQTNTYIVTPSRDKEPIFEVTGLPENVESARKEIEAHIAMRTGGGIIDSGDEADFHANGVDQVFPANLNNMNAFNGGTVYKSDLNAFYSRDSNNGLLTPRSQEIFSFPPVTTTVGGPKLTDMYTSTFTNSLSNGFGMYESDEGLGESPTFDPTIVWPEFPQSGNSNGSTGGGSTSSGSGSEGSSFTGGLARRSSSLHSAIGETILGEHPPAGRIGSDPLATTFPPAPVSGGSMASSPTDSLGSGKKTKRDCIVCFESGVVAALVPCGHNMFCLECANRICDKTDSECPVCHQPCSQAIRIYS